MAARYAPQAPRQEDYFDWSGEPRTCVVLCDADTAVSTGLLDAHGAPLYRLREPIGFRGRKSDV